MVVGIDIVAAIGLLADWIKWKEEAALLADNAWLEEAKKQGLLPADRKYAWSVPEKVEARLLAGSHKIVWVADKVTRTRRRVVDRSGGVLLATLPPKE